MLFRSGGPVRQLLERMEAIMTQQAFVIAWGGTPGQEQQVYIDRYPELVPLLRQCPYVVNETQTLLTFADALETITLRLTYSTKKSAFTSRVTLSQTTQAITTCLSERFVLSGNEIYEVLPLGPSYARLKDFEATFPETFLAQCISLFVSHIDNARIDYAGYTIQSGEIIHARPVVFIDEIGQNNHLHMRLGVVAGVFEPDWFEQYAVTKICQIQEEEKVISLHELAVTAAAEAHAWLLDSIARHQKTARIKGGIIQDETGITLTPELARVVLENELG